MLVAIVLTPLSVVALVAVCVAVLPLKGVLALGATALIGLVMAVRDQRRGSDAQLLAEGEELELQGIVDRLCVAADLPRPEIALDEERQPNSWIVDPPGRRPRLHVTRGLLDLLEPAELEAVVAHELSHVAHHDATVMTVVGLPGIAMLEGAHRGSWAFGPLVAGRVLGFAIGTISEVGNSALSRHRELTADAGAAALTGRPSALASALMKVSGAIGALPTEDLRLVAARDALHLVAVEDSRWRVLTTHPSIAKRVAALERLERRMVTTRAASPRG
ncbi:Protease HtpX [Baekduia alba]|nr:Protease HtpX [Baekduia alba]